MDEFNEQMLAELLHDAALQAFYMRARQQDLKDASDGYQFIYAIDANIIRLWGNPTNDDADRQGEYEKIGRIFRHDSEQLANAISWSLLSYIFEILYNGHIPFLIIPPMENEIRGMLEAIHDDALTKNKTNANDGGEVYKELRAINEQLGVGVPSSDLSEINLKLQTLLFQELSQWAELRRLTLLFVRNVVDTLDECVEKLPDVVREILLPTAGAIGSWYEYGVAKSGERVRGGREGWDQRLARAGTWKRDELRETDATVLSRLEVWNRQLSKNHSSGKWRILYLTVDHRLFRAAGTFHPPELYGRTFADGYLRHPRAYLSEDGVLGAVDADLPEERTYSRRETVGDWLTLLTQPANVAFNDLLDARKSRHLASRQDVISDFASRMTQDRGGDKATSALVNELMAKWARFAQGALAVNPREPVAFESFTSDRATPAKKLYHALGEAHGRLENDRRQRIQDYLVVTTKLGRKVENAQAAKVLLRSVPPIYFEAWRQAARAIAIMSKWSEDKIDRNEYKSAIDDLDHNDPTSYAFYLGNAAFFAARGRWNSAILVARRARGISESFRAGDGFVDSAKGAHGREAAYFEASCRRRIAKDNQGLIAAQVALAAARAILAIEKRAGQYEDFVEERLDAEDVAVSFHRQLLHVFGNGPSERGGHTFREIAERQWQLLSQLAEKIKREQLDETVGIGDATYTRLIVEREHLIAILLTAYMPEAEAIDTERAREALRRFEQRNSEKASAADTLSEIEKIILFGARLRDSQAARNSEVRRQFFQTNEILNSVTSELLPHEGRIVTRIVELSSTAWPSL